MKIKKQIGNLGKDKLQQIVEAFISDLEQGAVAVLEYLEEVENPEFLELEIDTDNRIFSFTKKDGSHYLYNLHSETIDDIENRLLVLEEIFDTIENPEYSEATLDGSKKVLSYRKKDGTKVELVGFKTPKVEAEEINANKVKTDNLEANQVSIHGGEATLDNLNLTEEGMTAFQQALRDSGFQPGGAGDWTEYLSNDGDEPLIIPEPRCARLNIHSNFDLTKLSKAGRGDGVIGVNCEIPTLVEFYDMNGNYFKKWTLMSGQGDSSLAFIKKNLAFDFFDGEVGGDAFAVKFGNWVAQDSFHLKSYYNDAFRCVGAVAYDIYKEILDTRGIEKNAPYKLLASKGTEKNWNGYDGCVGGKDDFDANFDYEARCMPAGFPVIVYQNGEFFGVYSWQIKKNRNNYYQKKDNAKHIHLDGTISAATLFNGTINWTQFEIRNPKYLVYAEPHYNKVEKEDTYEYDADLAGQFEIAGLGAEETAAAWDSTTNFVKGRIVSKSSRLYMSKSDVNVGNDPSSASYGKKPKDVFKKSNEYWIEITFTNEVKQGIIRLSSYIPTLRTETETLTPEELKASIESKFFVDFLVDYIVCVNALYDIDSVGKNWQWTTWDGIKWVPNLYDCDVSWGNGVGGNELYPPSNEYIGQSSSINTPTKVIIDNYTPEIEARYKELKDAGIISIENFIKYVQDWILKVGKDTFKLEFDKWTDCPCNRPSGVNEEYWKVSSVWAAGTVTYDENHDYGVGDTCVFGESGNYYQYRFTCVKACGPNTANGVQAPCTVMYQFSPKYLGRYDSIYRLASWIRKRLEFVDNIFNY